MDGYFRVYGSKGSLEVDPAFNYDGLHLRGDLLRRQASTSLNPSRDPYQFHGRSRSLLQLRPQ